MQSKRARATVFLFGLGCSSLLGFAALVHGAPPASAPSVATHAAVDARNFGAVGDGKTDDTAAIQKALDAAARSVPVCFLPPGLYRLNGHLTVPAGVTLRGASGGAPHSEHPIGTVLLAYGGRGDPDGPPLITLKPNACVRNLVIHYPEQRLPDVAPYPWTIRCDGELCQVRDITMTNPYQAIDAGTKWNELHTIRNVFACPLKIGVYIDQCTDIGRIENVHFNPNFWTRMALAPGFPGGDIAGYLKNNLTGFLIGKTDWEYMTNCFVIFARIGYHFVRGRGTGGRGGPGNVVLTQCGADVGVVGVQVDELQGHAGVAFVNGQFMNTVSVNIGRKNRGPVKFSNCGFWGTGDTTSHVINAGTGPLVLTGCHFIGWDRRNHGDPAIRIVRGAVLINGCVFMDAAPGVVLESGVESAIVTGNIFNLLEPIRNRSAGKVEIGLNSFPEPQKEEPGAIVVDDREPGFSTRGTWHRATAGQDYQGSSLWTLKGSPDAVAVWRVKLPKPGKYEVFVWHGADPNGDHAGNARYEIATRRGVVEKRVDQTIGAGRWKSLGTFDFAEDAEVRLFARDADGNVVADAVKWVPRGADGQGAQRAR